MENRRAFVRIRLSEQVHLVVDGTIVESRLIDISRGGACVSRPEAWTVDPVVLDLILMGEHRGWTARCRVAWGDLQHLGLEFESPQDLPFEFEG